MSGSGNKPPLSCTPGGPPPAGNFGLHGRPIDVFTDPGGNRHALLFVRARHYDLTNGRWLQRDPMGYVDGPNLYEAFGGNPLANVDPDGEEKKVVSGWGNGDRLIWQQYWGSWKKYEFDLGLYYCDRGQKRVRVDMLNCPSDVVYYVVPFEMAEQWAVGGYTRDEWERFVRSNGQAVGYTQDGELGPVGPTMIQALVLGAIDQERHSNLSPDLRMLGYLSGMSTLDMSREEIVSVTQNWATMTYLLLAGSVGSAPAGEGGLLSQGATQTAALSQAERNLLAKMIRAARSEGFKAKARMAGFGKEQINALPPRLLQYGKSGQVVGSWGAVSSITPETLTISRYGGKGAIHHELGHLLDDIAHPGLLAAEGSMTYSQIVAAERTASLIQLGHAGWRTTIVPHLAAFETKTGFFHWTFYGAGSAIAYQAYKCLPEDR
jgi:RHS repeat-associated protein